MQENFEARLQKIEKMERRRTVIAVVLLIALAAGLAVIIPKINTISRQADEIYHEVKAIDFDKIASVVDDLDPDTIQEALNTVAGIDPEAIQKTLSKVEAIDIESLNKTLESLSKVADFFGAFGK